MTNPNPVAPKTDTPATQIPQTHPMRQFVRGMTRDQLEAYALGAFASKIATEQTLWHLESTLAAERASLYHAFVSGAKWWEFDSTKGTMWPSDQERVRAAAIERYPYCPHPLLREKEIELKAERASRVQADTELFNAGIEDGALHLENASDQTCGQQAFTLKWAAKQLRERKQSLPGRGNEKSGT